MAWSKTASRYVLHWVKTPESLSALARTVSLFFRDGVVAGVVVGVIVGACTTWR
jgi:hypothetical protein